MAINIDANTMHLIKNCIKKQFLNQLNLNASRINITSWDKADKYLKFTMCIKKIG